MVSRGDVDPARLQVVQNLVILGDDHLHQAKRPTSDLRRRPDHALVPSFGGRKRVGPSTISSRQDNEATALQFGDAAPLEELPDALDGEEGSIEVAPLPGSAQLIEGCKLNGRPGEASSPHLVLAEMKS
jgi:hypothetical protein